MRRKVNLADKMEARKLLEDIFGEAAKDGRIDLDKGEKWVAHTLDSIERDQMGQIQRKSGLGSTISIDLTRSGG